jgi:hypothetical protein
MSDVTKFIITMSCSLVILGVLMIYFAGNYLFTFTTFDELNERNTINITISSFVWGVMGTYIILFVWLSYSFHIITEKIWGGIAAVLSITAGATM